MKKVKLYNPTFEALKISKRVVPRDKNNYIINVFSVGRNYIVTNEEGTESLNVICTQNYPTHIKIV